MFFSIVNKLPAIILKLNQCSRDSRKRIVRIKQVLMINIYSFYRGTVPKLFFKIQSILCFSYNPGGFDRGRASARSLRQNLSFLEQTRRLTGRTMNFQSSFSLSLRVCYCCSGITFLCTSMYSNFLGFYGKTIRVVES